MTRLERSPAGERERWTDIGRAEMLWMRGGRFLLQGLMLGAVAIGVGACASSAASRSSRVASVVYAIDRPHGFVVDGHRAVVVRDGRATREERDALLVQLKRLGVSRVSFRSGWKMMPSEQCAFYRLLSDSGIEILEFWLPTSDMPAGETNVAKQWSMSPPCGDTGADQ